MKIYRICTEAKQVERISKFAGNIFEGCSIFEGIGYWKGTKELCMVIEVLTTDIGTRDRVMEFAEEVKRINKQDCVLVQEIECRGEFV